MKKAELLQQHLSIFRTCAGWTAQELADMLEVSRQTISAWENYNEQNNKGVKLSAGYYLAIRKLLDDEIEKDICQVSTDRKQHILGTLLEILVDNPNEYSKEDVEAVLKEAQLLAPSIKHSESRKEVSKIWPYVIIGCGVAISATLYAIIKNKND